MHCPTDIVHTPFTVLLTPTSAPLTLSTHHPLPYWHIHCSTVQSPERVSLCAGECKQPGRGLVAAAVGGAGEESHVSALYSGFYRTDCQLREDHVRMYCCLSSICSNVPPCTSSSSFPAVPVFAECSSCSRVFQLFQVVFFWVPVVPKCSSYSRLPAVPVFQSVTIVPAIPKRSSFSRVLQLSCCSSCFSFPAVPVFLLLLLFRFS